MEPFQFVFLMLQIAFALVVLYPVYLVISKLVRAFVKTTRKTKTTLFG